MAETYVLEFENLKEANLAEFQELLKTKGYLWVNSLSSLDLFNLSNEKQRELAMKGSVNAFEKLIEARFFDNKSEFRFFRNHENRVMQLTFNHFLEAQEKECLNNGLFWTEERQTVTKRKDFDEHNRVQLIVRKYFGFDIQGQAQILDTLLYDCEVIEGER